MSGLRPGDGLHRGLRLLGLAANLHILLLINQQSESLAHEWMIVDDKNRLLGSLRGSSPKRHLLSFAYPFT